MARTTHARSGLEILLEDCCVHMSCYRNDVILQLLQVLLVCYGAPHKHQSNKPLLADSTQHGEFCRRQLPDFEWIFRGPQPGLLLLLLHELIEVETGFITKSQAV